MLMTDDFFRNRLDQLIDLRHPLAVLANRMPWGNRPLEPRALEVEFFPMEEVLHEKVKIH